MAARQLGRQDKGAKGDLTDVGDTRVSMGLGEGWERPPHSDREHWRQEQIAARHTKGNQPAAIHASLQGRKLTTTTSGITDAGDTHSVSTGSRRGAGGPPSWQTGGNDDGAEGAQARIGAQHGARKWEAAATASAAGTSNTSSRRNRSSGTHNRATQSTSTRGHAPFKDVEGTEARERAQGSDGCGEHKLTRTGTRAGVATGLQGGAPPTPAQGRGAGTDRPRQQVRRDRRSLGRGQLRGQQEQRCGTATARSADGSSGHQQGEQGQRQRETAATGAPGGSSFGSNGSSRTRRQQRDQKMAAMGSGFNTGSSNARQQREQRETVTREAAGAAARRDSSSGKGSG
mmetsp:Transcript_5164/g.10385  ORF Transcript_5164/g.10385 Transcript_5164/m.10385 type:complete len:344 (-) Transcript_5164:195-1226(-)